MGGTLQEFSLSVLYAISIVSGALGGCAAGVYYSRKQAGMLSWALIAAYVILGLVFGVIVFAGGSMLHIQFTSVHELILWSLAGGSGGSLALFSANWTVKAVFERFGIEVEISLKKKSKPGQDPDPEESETTS